MQEVRLGKYSNLREIASGAQGTVYRAYDPDAGRDIALKVLLSGLANEAGYLARFDLEATLASAVDHPNVVRIFGFGHEDGQHFIAMEFVPSALNARITSGGLPIDDVIDISLGTAKGLAAIHTQGITHRDLKPHNILIDADGNPKVTDFGIARSEDFGTMTRAGDIMGSPPYMSPEQANGTKASPRSDVYALGCVMYEMLWGQPPFTASEAMAVLRKHIEEEMVPIQERRPEVPDELARVVARATQKAPEDRYADGAEMAAALRDVVEILRPIETRIPDDGRHDLTDDTEDKIDGGDEGGGDDGTGCTVPPDDDGRPTPWGFWALVLIGLLIAAWKLCWLPIFCDPPADDVEVVHWATGHLFFDGGLQDMAARFNEEDHRTDSGGRVRVKVVNNPSSSQVEDLLSRVTTGVRLSAECCPAQPQPHPDPTIITPSSDQRLPALNQAAARTVVDPDSADDVARAYVGIVTYREMAECMGWPEREIGFGDIISLRDDPRGWSAYPSCARQEWGERPLVAFTDPSTSSTGRSVLLALYAIGAGKSPEQLTVEDVNHPRVSAFVERFAGLVDHYMIGTSVLNTKVHQGPRFGHFFLMPEDNLVHLGDGTVSAFINGEKVTAPPVDQPMVMIYPKEGAMARDNCACIVDAPWVTPDERNGAEKWIAYLREDEQQRAFAAAGFRPATGLAGIEHPGLDAREPAAQLDVGRIDPMVSAAIDEAWPRVKRPGIVTFVVDTSGSMEGEKIEQVTDGLERGLDGVDGSYQVGVATFGTDVSTRVPVGSLATNRALISSVIHNFQPRGGTALYEAVRVGMEMTDSAPGDSRAIRAVVVLTDGRANEGMADLDDLVSMRDAHGVPVTGFDGFSPQGVLEGGASIAVEEIIGSGQALQTEHPIQVFYLGIGDDADLEIGRILTEATNAEYRGVQEEELADVIADYINYF